MAAAVVRYLQEQVSRLFRGAEINIITRYLRRSDVYLFDLQQCDETTSGERFLAQVSNFVSTYRHKSLTLKNPAGATWRIGGLEDTIYRDEPEEVNAWGKFYLPEMVNMRVVGVVEGSSCPCEQLVLMTCENKKLYAYDGEELHLVVSSWNQLNNKEIEYPASKSYYNGEAFQDMTEDDWADVRKGAVGRRLEQEHQKLVQENKKALLESLSGHT
ncbi:uncharacterized protein LOC128374088 isoform X1 [Scomber japonicus]|uniref:uncharacterized protein LOC128374088 isoform X1 n=1 Tax=Scomber japonicus TaxID=13676 RepID=UPI002306237A|nr:uncharacterized protein LOC128374088 isoform X1 [Scomber japonicus]